jgi:hypothetical protein
MKKISTLWVVAIVLSALGTPLATAVPVNITVDDIANKTQYGQQNNNPSSNLAFLESQILLWNLNNPELPSENLQLALNQENLSGSLYNAPAGYDYVVFHFGAGRAGGRGVSPGGWWQAFYLNDEVGQFTVPSVGGEPVGGFSSARLYNATVPSVPDGGSTAMLLGLAISGITLAWRKLGV